MRRVMDSPVLLVVVPHTACVPHTAVLPDVPPVPHTAVLPHTALVPQRAVRPSTNTVLPQTAAGPHTSVVPHTAWVPHTAVFAFTMAAVFFNESKTATGDAAVLPAGTESLLLSAPQTSRYPAPIVKISYWLVYMIPVTGSVAVLFDGKFLVAVFIKRTLTVSGVKLASFCNIRAAAPLTIAAAMLVPLSL